MLHTPIDRPNPPENKVTTSQDFELCYLRHQYLRRVKYNPTEEEMAPYLKIVHHFTKNTYGVYINLFTSVGMYQDDVFNIGRVHLVSFLGLYSLEQNEKKRYELTVRYLLNGKMEPSQGDLDQKNKANFTYFFKQRMEDLVRVCRQKVRNIKGQPAEEYAVFCGKDKPPRYPRKLLKKYEELGYKKLDFAVFKSIRKKADVNHDATMFQFNDTWYVAFALEQKNLDLEDIVGSDSNPYVNTHNLRPDELYESVPISDPNWNRFDKDWAFSQEEKETTVFHKLFNEKSDCGKRVLLRNFIEKNQYKRYYQKEIVTARKLLRSLGE